MPNIFSDPVWALAYPAAATANPAKEYLIKLNCGAPKAFVKDP